MTVEPDRLVMVRGLSRDHVRWDWGRVTEIPNPGTAIVRWHRRRSTTLEDVDTLAPLEIG